MRRTLIKRINESTKGYFKFLVIVLIIGIVFLFRKNVYERVIVNGHSMEPNFYDCDICLSDKNYKSIDRYDVVVAKINNETIIKRVIGLPGDQIRIKDGTVYINDEKIDRTYDYLTYPDGTKDYQRIDSDSGDEFELLIDGNKVTKEATFSCDKDEYFLMGDNRQHSADCRVIGPVKSEDITGKIVIRFFPFDRIKCF